MWIVMTSCAQAPAPHGRNGSRYGSYRNIALVEIRGGEHGWRPARIDARITGVLQVEHWGRFYVGLTDRGAYQQAMMRAVSIVEERNGETAWNSDAAKRAAPD